MWKYREAGPVSMNTLGWVGCEHPFVDEVSVVQVNQVTVGRFGGNSAAGAYKNEDGCIVWADVQQEWEFAMVLDAHYSADSAALIVNRFQQEQMNVKTILSQSSPVALKQIEEHILTVLQNHDFLQACREVKGETACLFVVRKEKYVWWLSVGDCMLYLLHPELADLGQYLLNERQFYEWIGQVNTFDQPVPCFTRGTRELRTGSNQIFLTTDGLTECPGEPYAESEAIYHALMEISADIAVIKMLSTIQEHHVRDSTTIITWNVHVVEQASMPSDL